MKTFVNIVIAFTAGIIAGLVLSAYLPDVELQFFVPKPNASELHDKAQKKQLVERRNRFGKQMIDWKEIEGIANKKRSAVKNQVWPKFEDMLERAKNGQSIALENLQKIEWDNKLGFVGPTEYIESVIQNPSLISQRRVDDINVLIDEFKESQKKYDEDVNSTEQPQPDEELKADIDNFELEFIHLFKQAKLALNDIDIFEQKRKANLFSAMTVVATQTKNRVISGIFYDQDTSIAVLDGQKIKTGDIIHGATVLKINEDLVVFQKNGNMWTQRIKQVPPEHWQADTESSNN